MKRITNIIILSTLLIIVATQSVMASGVFVKPMQLNFVLEAGQEETKNIVVENISSQPVIYNLYADELEDQIFLAPANFRLEVGQKRQVKVKVQPEKAGIFATNLSIVSQDLDRRKFNVSTGVKIPVVLQVSPASKSYLSTLVNKIIMILLPILVVVIVGLIIIKKKKKNWWQKFF